MIRRSAGVLGVLIASLIGAAAGGAAENPPGPRLALTRVNESRSELVTVDPSGSNPQVLVDDRSPGRLFAISPSSWSADGEKLAFVGISDDNDDVHLDIYVLAVEDGEIFQVPGTRNGSHPVLSPDGHSIAFTRSKPGKEGKKQNGLIGTAVWIADLAGGVVRRITPYKRRVSDSASSFSPDGSTLLLTRTVGIGAPAAVSIDLSRGRATTIAKRAADPVLHRTEPGSHSCACRGGSFGRTIQQGTSPPTST
jgi:Tol biopolymer transport system component